jgi:hypothetical protein
VTQLYTCPSCPDSVFDSRRRLDTHCCASSPSSCEDEEDDGGDGLARQVGGAPDVLPVVQSALNRAVEARREDFEPGQFMSFADMFSEVMPRLVRTLIQAVTSRRIFKFTLVVRVRYIKEDPESGEVEDDIVVPFSSGSRTIFRGDARNLRRILAIMAAEIATRDQALQAAGSGWVMHGMVSVGLDISGVRLVGGCRTKRNDALLAARPELTDVDSPKDLCFFYAVAVGFAPEEVRGRPALLKCWCRRYVAHGMDCRKVKAPVALGDISKFVRRNKKLDVRLNVFVYKKDGKSFPVFRSDKGGGGKIVNLLMLPVFPAKGIYHYVFINDLNRCFRSARNAYKCFVCSNCLLSYSRQKSLDEHLALCELGENQRVILPRPESYVQFEHERFEVKLPLIGYCDFEACLPRKAAGVCHLCAALARPGVCGHKSNIVSEHVPVTYSVMFVDCRGRIIFQRTESDDENVMQKFCELLMRLEPLLEERLTRYKKRMPLLTSLQQTEYDARKLCYLCKTSFDNSYMSYRKVRDHDHYTGEYLGPAHNKCNLRRRSKGTVPVYVHNLSNYDMHFIVAALKHYHGGAVKALPFNLEKFRTLKLGSFLFLDSMHLVPGSLAELVDDLAASDHSFPLLKVSGMYACERQRSLLLRKGIFPYEFATSVRKLRETLQIPPIEDFYSQLRGAALSPEDHARARTVFDEFGCTDMLQYSEMYCRLDVVLLAEVVEAFRATMYDDFKLDCAHYISLPSLSFDCMLKTVGRKVELCSDPDMVLMFEQNIRGGVSFVNCRHVKIPDSVTAQEPEDMDENLFYLDCNNLYSVSQLSPLPVGAYRWVPPEEHASFDWAQLGRSTQSEGEGYVVECDLEYPSSMHSLHNSLPLAPQHKALFYSDLCEYTRECLRIFRSSLKAAKKYSSVKLCSTLEKKEKYVCHYRNLATYLRHGMKLVRVYRVVGFREETFIAPYIELMTRRRVESKTSFKKRTYKLCMNAVYGKFLEQVRKHMTVKIVQSGAACERYMAHPRYVGHRILSEDHVAIFLCKRTVRLDKLFAVGFSILEISKDHMFQLYYDTIVPACGEGNVEVVLTDTDSLLLHVKNQTRRQFLDALECVLDFSNYPKSHPRFSDSKKARPGYLKDETPGRFISEVVGLKSKSYALQVDGGGVRELKPVCKGITRVAKSKFTLDTYKKCLLTKQQIDSEMFSFRSTKHKITTRRICKVGLSSSDDKRFLHRCGIHTKAYGHYKAFNVCDICK